jgi:hypothetical protein
MGLDMYLSKKTYLGANYKHNNVTGKLELLANGKPINVQLNRVTYIIEEIGYWRKANQIHSWFVNNIQEGKDDCGEYYISEDKMIELLALCKKIKEQCPLVDGAITNGYRFENGIKMPIVQEGKEMANPEIAQVLLPAQSGFFFGSTDYDEYYMADIDNTIEILEAALKEEGDFYYSASW